MLPNTAAIKSENTPQKLTTHAYYDKKAGSLVIGKTHTIPITPVGPIIATLHGACWVFSIHPSPFAKKGGKDMLEEANIYTLLHLEYDGEDEKPFSGFISLKLEGSKSLPMDMLLQVMMNGDIDALSPLKQAQGIYIDALITKMMSKRASGVELSLGQIDDHETYTPTWNTNLAFHPASYDKGKYTIQTIMLAPVGYTPTPVRRAVKLLEKGIKEVNAYVIKTATNSTILPQQQKHTPDSAVIDSWKEMMASYKEYTAKDERSSFVIQGLVYDTGTSLIMLDEANVCSKGVENVESGNDNEDGSYTENEM